MGTLDGGLGSRRDRKPRSAAPGLLCLRLWSWGCGCRGGMAAGRVQLPRVQTALPAALPEVCLRVRDVLGPSLGGSREDRRGAGGRLAELSAAGGRAGHHIKKERIE